MGDDLSFTGPPAGKTKLNGLTAWLYGLDEVRVVVSFEELERITGAKLNKSLRSYQSAWTTPDYARYWRPTGYRPTFRNVPSGHIGFVRED